MNGSGAAEDVDGNEGGRDEEGSDVVWDELDICAGHEVAAEVEGGHWDYKIDDRWWRWRRW
jgi:hypothetical protein